MESDGFESEEDDGLAGDELDCAIAAAATIEITRKRRKILFMLDLTALPRILKPQLLGCKAAGGKVPLFYREGRADGKKQGSVREKWRNRKVRDRWENC